MHIEVLCTGDELLDGTVVDTNSPFFMEKVFSLGERIMRRDTVPDDLSLIASTLRAMGERSDFVLVSGGLGPTADDLTAEAAARAAGVGMALHEPTWTSIQERMSHRGLAVTENNKRQAMVPEGCEVVANRYGTAPMIVLKIGRATACLLPGVPREFKPLCEEEMLPRLTRALGDGRKLFRAGRILKCYGLAESHMDDAVREFPKRHPHLRVGFRTTLPENHLKLLAEGASPEEAQARLATAEGEARELLGHALFGADRMSFSQAIGELLRRHGATLGIAESCTGGLCAALLTEVPGSSDYFRASLVTYASDTKTHLLGVPAALIEKEGVVSEPVALAMARGARERTQASLGIGVTGIAGPTGGSDAIPIGTVCLALAAADRTIVKKVRFGGDRERVRKFAAYAALDLVRDYYRPEGSR